MLDNIETNSNLNDLEEQTAELVGKARQVASELKTRVRDTEQARRLPVENMERICDEGLLTVIQSKNCGGHELSMRAHLDVLSAIAEGCSATAWVLGVMHAHSWLLAHFPKKAQDEVYKKNPNTMVSAVIGPRGKAIRKTDGTYVLNGFWPFGSGCQLSKWLLLGAEVFDEDGNFLDLADLLIPTSDAEIQDDWYVAAFQGTGSNSLVVKDLEIPTHRYLSLMGLLKHETPGITTDYTGWLHKAEPVPVLAIALCGGAVGLGRAAKKQFMENIQGKTVMYTEHVQTEWASTHITLGKAASQIDAGELLIYRAADDTDRLAQLGEQMSMEMRGRIRMDCSHGVRLILEGATDLYIAGGAAGIAIKNPMQQISRDLHATNMHGLLLMEPSAEVYGRILLGLEANTIII
ncbi:acyl-CoA dehydrogenase family protein [Gammaproteobacteria bacterium]|nr:acyl-CoA dehydrogenase family protein [Gammaproteobacteria bacterium]|tara:strand:- start:1729 stop:2946 length:1218 start_codon:yes stop_codon:yes gene_type:complete